MSTYSGYATPPRPLIERSLRRLARASFAHRKGIVVVTGLFVVVAGFFGGNVSSRLSQGGFDAPSEQSVHAANVLASEFHNGTDNIILLVHATSGTVDSAAVAAAGAELTRELAAQPHMANVMSYWSLGAVPILRTANKSEALVVGRITGDQNQVVQREPVIAAALSHAGGPVTVKVGGFGAAFHEVNTVVEHDLFRAEAFAVPLTFLLLLFVFGSLVAAAMPLAIGAVAVVGTLLTLRLINGVTPVSVFAVNLTTVMGLGLAIDYSLFIVSRFREELHAGRDVQTALEETLVHAGRTAAGSALTVAAAVSALLVFPLMFLRSFAYSGIAVSVLAGVASLVVLPAVLALLGPRINSVAVWRRSILPPLDGFWSKMARAVMRRPVVVIAGVCVVLAVLAAPFLHIKLGYLDDRVLSPSDQVRKVDDALRTDFGQGQTDALQVVAANTGSTTPAQQAGYAASLSQLPGVQRVDSAAGGLQRTGRIITAAALLMSIVFFGLVTSGIAFMKLFAVGLTFAVLLDAFVIRGSMLVPAVMKLAGSANWWAPPFMRKRIPPPPPEDRYPIDPDYVRESELTPALIGPRT